MHFADKHVLCEPACWRICITPVPSLTNPSLLFQRDEVMILVGLHCIRPNNSTFEKRFFNDS